MNEKTGNFQLMNLNQHPDLLEQLHKWESELHKNTGVKVALIAYEREQMKHLREKELN